MLNSSLISWYMDEKGQQKKGLAGTAALALFLPRSAGLIS